MKIKILFYIDTLIGGGAEKVLRTLVSSMDKSKFDITVQTTFKEDTENLLSEGIRYKYCYSNKNTLSNILFRAEAALNTIYPLHIKGDYDIEVSYLECASTKIMSGSTNKKAKKLAWVHCDLRKITDDPNSFAEKTKPWYDKFDKVICVSESVKEAFIEMFGNSPETEVIYNTIDTRSILEKSNENLPDAVTKSKLTLIMLGRFAPPKNYPRLLKTVKELLDDGFDFDLWILGDGEERPDIEKYISENNLSDSIKLLGFQKNPYPFIKNADLLVCSSNYEGFSTFVTEGLILGKTVVTTNCSGMNELLGNNEFGLITENDDEAFKNGLREILSNPDLLAEYTQKAKIRGKLFSEEKLTADTEDLFFRTLEK
ncbi:MAG: glycosyltransferase [Clostridia bacterium]|nr:glycosyltransferase [Clostridia bacterium]